MNLVFQYIFFLYFKFNQYVKIPKTHYLLNT